VHLQKLIISHLPSYIDEGIGRKEKDLLAKRVHREE